ncbi:ATP-grasp domain-containing protein [Cohnella thailandensis]|uniref:ATP-grasp domain-containing protein n=1 Tax=Cohnella thailandensis TaxID=557557 RepID=A0A841SJX3_9BACL|nr:hypothetical protein [Cohnella thailandensis]MBB6632823.1 hypothetical protein [Cohnella thailandensis]MBP1975485.1 glutathione synthase/RimK-type ligase-like ATP-grasp enzyme [Cohnella thailandensis]
MTAVRPYLSLIQRAGASVGVSFREIEAGQIYSASYEDKQFAMYNVDLGLNDSSSFLIAKSKASTHSVLASAGIPSVEHRFLLNPNSKYSSEDAFRKAERLFEQYGSDAVVKRDDGAQGENVFRVTSLGELRERLARLFSLELNAAISPYRSSELEYRVVVLNDEVRLAFSKSRTSSWKHNLSGGASVGGIEPSLEDALFKLAADAANAVGLAFCSVDILNTSEGLQVLEVNGTVFLSEFIKGNAEREKRAFRLFQDAFRTKFRMRD